MKKNAFLAAFLLCGFLANAQDQPAQSSDIKPVAKSITAEVNFSPIGNPPISIPYLKGRYFLTDNVAIRAGFDLGFQHNAPSKDLSQNMFQMSIVPGIEKHFAGTNRLSPYIGADVNVGFSSASTQITANNVTTDIKGAWTDATGGNPTNRGNFHFGVGAVAGADYYFARHFYTGLEIGYGMMVTSFSDITTNGTVTDRGGSNFTLGTNVNGGIRLGFIF